MNATDEGVPVTARAGSTGVFTRTLPTASGGATTESACSTSSPGSRSVNDVGVDGSLRARNRRTRGPFIIGERQRLRRGSWFLTIPSSDGATPRMHARCYLSARRPDRQPSSLPRTCPPSCRARRSSTGGVCCCYVGIVEARTRPALLARGRGWFRSRHAAATDRRAVRGTAASPLPFLLADDSVSQRASLGPPAVIRVRRS